MLKLSMMRYFIDDPIFFWYLLKQMTGLYRNPFA